jgi:hypothetical protein
MMLVMNVSEVEKHELSAEAIWWEQSAFVMLFRTDMRRVALLPKGPRISRQCSTR